MNIPKVHYVACCTWDDGLYSCGHKHESVREAMHCLIPTGGSFVRAFDSGAFRSLDNREFIDFLEALPDMPWSARMNAQEGADVVPSAER